LGRFIGHRNHIDRAKGGGTQRNFCWLIRASVGKQAREENLDPEVEAQDNRKGGGKKDLFHGLDLFDASKLSDNPEAKKDRFGPLPGFCAA
jgi:hypothetical protein